MQKETSILKRIRLYSRMMLKENFGLRSGSMVVKKGLDLML